MASGVSLNKHVQLYVVTVWPNCVIAGSSIVVVDGDGGEAHRRLLLAVVLPPSLTFSDAASGGDASTKAVKTSDRKVTPSKIRYYWLQ